MVAARSPAAKSARVRQPKQAVRMDLRVSPEQKRHLQRAAALSGQTLSSLVVRGALREADQAIKDRETMTLSAKDSRAFVEAVLNPPEPAPRLLEAIERYKAEFGRQSV